MQDSAIPSFFIGHGSPVLAIEDDTYAAFLARLGAQYKPKAVVIFTAHWESTVLTISSRDDTYETIYDWESVFPKKLHEVVYPAKGSTKDAEIIRQRFAAKDIKAELDTTRGLDHGSWTVLCRLYAAANIPVVQVSVNQNLSSEELYKIGDALKGLGEEGYMVIGSGATCHNDNFMSRKKEIDEWAPEFDNWLLEKAAAKDLKAIFNIETEAPNYRNPVPKGGAEHFVPWLIALGAGKLENVKMIWQEYRSGNLGYACYEF